jgi:hypothetical protein
MTAGEGRTDTRLDVHRRIGGGDLPCHDTSRRDRRVVPSSGDDRIFMVAVRAMLFDTFGTVVD